MITVNDAAAIGDTFELGPNPVLTGPVARGEVGEVWKLTTDAAVWAVKESFEPPSLTQAEHDARYQKLVVGAGGNVPRIQRAADGRVLADIGGSLVRVYGWVDLADSDISIDPAAVGKVLASIHRVVCHDANDVHATGRTVVWPIRAKSSLSSCSSTAAVRPIGCACSTRRTSTAAGQGGCISSATSRC